MEKFDLEKFPTSESAQRMLSYVSDGFYDKSYIGKWLFQVMGAEYDEARRVIKELPTQLFPETATWGLMYHEIKWGLPIRENLSDEERRRLIYEKRDYKAPMTPYRMEQYLANVTGFDVHVTDIHDSWNGYLPEHPNQFRVFFVGEGMLNAKAALSAIRRIKQSHTRFEASEYIVSKFGVNVFYNTQMRMTGAFYPRDNIPLFYLDGTAGLDGEYYLDGFLSGESLDFYPVALQIIAGADWRTERVGTAVTSLYFRPEIQLDVQNDTIFRLWGAILTGGTVTGEMRLLFDTCPKTALNAGILLRAHTIQPIEIKNFLCVQGAAAMKTVASGGLHLAGEIQAKNTFDGKITARTEIIQTLTSRESLTLAGEIYAKKNLASRLYFAGGIGAETKVSGEITTKAQAVQLMGEDTSFSIQGAAGAEGNVCAQELQISGGIGEAGKTVSITSGLRIEKNWGTLDGSELLDGSRILDAEVYTEEI